jgi:hypothetical protein
MANTRRIIITMNTEDIIKEAKSILAEERYALLERQARERKERREALASAALFFGLVAGSLVAVYGIVFLAFKLILR